ncbi:MAG: putative Ig domain-containing protein, partial [bacterium JZ-2024 1]
MVRNQGEIKKLLLRAGYAGIFVVMGIWASCGRSGGLPPAPPPGLSPNIEPPTAPPATVGVPYNLSFRWTVNTAKPPFFWHLIGSMPPGLQFDPANGRIFGTPTTPGSFSFTMVVRDSNSPQREESRSYTLLVNGAPDPITITPGAGPLPKGKVGIPYSQEIHIRGGYPPYTCSVDGMLPPGISLNPSTCTLSGTPTQTGVWVFTIFVFDSQIPPNSASVTYTLNIIDPLQILTEEMPVGKVGEAYSFQLLAKGGVPCGGGPPYTWAFESGYFPPGLTLNPNGTVTGTPTASGFFDFLVRVSDCDDMDPGPGVVPETATKNVKITIVGPLTITTTVLPDGYVTIPYNQPLSVSGGIGPYVWELVDFSLSGGACSASGPLPPELTLSTDGTISGTPIIANTTGYDLCVRVTDANGQTDYQQLRLRILQDIVLCVDGVNGDDSTGDGTSARPFKTINRALAYASDNNTDPSGTLPRIGAIRVAGTTFGAPLVYHEDIVLDALNGTDVDLLGGWTGSPGNFCAYRGNVPNSRIKGLAGVNPTIFTVGLTRDTWIELFEIEGNDAPFQTSRAIINVGSSPTIARNTIRGGNASGANAISAGIYNLSSSPLIVENDIYGGTGASDSRGVWDDAGSTSEIRDNTIDGGDPSGGGTTTSAGVKSSAGSNPLIYDNIITGGTGANSYGIWVDP